LRIVASRVVPDPDWPQSAIHNPQFILKSVHEHASFQLDDASIVAATSIEQVAMLARQREMETGRPFFAEEFIDGREFNLAVWGHEPEVLPPAEIDFSTFPAGKPRIVGHRAKWETESFEYDQTERLFQFPPDDRSLLAQLHELAIDCWRLFGLRSYARIDFRVDRVGQPWILEINTNPCLSPAAGFATTLQQAGIGYDEGIHRILELAIAGRVQAAHAFA
jgi:D-alanine-D-alanine ligase